MSEAQADTIVILSSELIAKITQEYFNKTMFKQKVEIVDLKPHGESGYAFSVAFVSTVPKVASHEPATETAAQVWDRHQAHLQSVAENGNNRDQRGRFAKHG